MRTFVVIPAFNEEERIQATVTSVHDAGQYDVVVVDDGSTDATASRVPSYAALIRHSVNRGMGAALVTGTAFALAHGADCVVHFDADGQHRAEDIAGLLAPLRAGTVDIVLGSRYLRPDSVPKTKKYLIHKPAIVFQNLLTGVRLTDAHNGFRAMTRSAAEKISITQDRMAHNTEIIQEIRRNKLRYVEVPVRIVYREYGQGLKAGVQILRDLIVKKLIR